MTRAKVVVWHLLDEVVLQNSVLRNRNVLIIPLSQLLFDACYGNSTHAWYVEELMTFRYLGKSY